jgi:predicted RNase H-like nuclease (RuvC/YqgF family)
LWSYKWVSGFVLLSYRINSIEIFFYHPSIQFLEEDEPITQEELRQQLRAQDREINVLRQQFRLQQEISRVQQEISQVQQQQIQYLLNQFGIEQQRIHRQLCKSQWANQITNLQFQIDQLKNQIANFAPQVDQLSQQIDQASCSRQSQEFPQPQVHFQTLNDPIII